jgi:hypothetical protein
MQRKTSMIESNNVGRSEEEQTFMYGMGRLSEIF